MDCDSPAYWQHPQIQATYSIWQKSPQSLAFVHEWLRWCSQPAVLTDEIALARIRNFPDFIDHRHDQSVLTNLAIKRGVKCYGRTDSVLPGSKDINNLVDRIQGKELSIIARTLGRTLERQVRSRFHLLSSRIFR
jgi:hypothetical protein